MLAFEFSAKPHLAAPSRVEGWFIFLLTVTFVALLGALAVTENAVNWRALAAVAHAVDILQQEDTVNLALIGFIEPPLPVLAQLPLAWLFPTAAATGNTVWILGALIAGLTLVMINATAASLNVAPPLRWLLCVCMGLNPVYLGLVTTGAPDGLYVLLLLGAGKHLLSWQAQELLRNLVGCSLFLALAFLTRYDAIIPISIAALVIGIQTWRGEKSWAKVEGTLLTFLLPIVYGAGLWILANWIIMGDPWHFLRETQGANDIPLSVNSPWVSVIGSAAVFPPVLAAGWWAIWGAAYEKPRLGVGVALMLLSPALLFGLVPKGFMSWIAHSQQALLPLLSVPDLFPSVLAGGVLLTAAALGDWKALFQRNDFATRICLAGTAALLATGYLLVMGDEERVYLDPRSTFEGKPWGADDATSTKTIARRLRTSAPQGTVIVAGWPGYAVTLYAERTKYKILLVRPEPFEKLLPTPPVTALLVRDAPPFTSQIWACVLGLTLPAAPEWSLEGWSYYTLSRRPIDETTPLGAQATSTLPPHNRGGPQVYPRKSRP